jgi:DNA-binding CsgD family transcriptional regulator
MAARRCLTPVADTVDVNGDPLKCPLTPREVEVLQLGAEGRSTREIADVLFVSPGTVKTHFQHVYEKLGSRDRAAAVAEALRRGLIA